MKVLSLVTVGPLLQMFTVTFHAPSSFPPAVRCPVAVGATMLANAHATTKEAIMFLSNCVFISVIFFSNVNKPFVHSLPCGKRVRWSSWGRRLTDLAQLRACRKFQRSVN